MADVMHPPCPAVTGELFADLLNGDLSHAARAAYFVHLQSCGECQQRLLAEAPELLLAAAGENLAPPAPLELPRLIARLPERSRVSYWRIAAMLLVLFASGILLVRKGVLPFHETGVQQAANPASAVHSAAVPPIQSIAAVTQDQPAIESGADDFQIREYEAPGFDGKPVQWVRMTPEALPAASGAARS